RHTRFSRDWNSDVCSSDLEEVLERWRPHHEGIGSDTPPPKLVRRMPKERIPMNPGDVGTVIELAGVTIRVEIPGAKIVIRRMNGDRKSVVEGKSVCRGCAR